MCKQAELPVLEAHLPLPINRERSLGRLSFVGNEQESFATTDISNITQSNNKVQHKRRYSQLAGLVHKVCSLFKSPSSAVYQHGRNVIGNNEPVNKIEDAWVETNTSSVPKTQSIGSCNILLGSESQSSFVKNDTSASRVKMVKSHTVPDRMPSLIVLRNEPSLSSPGSEFLSLDEFLHRRTIGKGTFGRVRLVQHCKTGECFALKIIKKSYVSNKRRLEHTFSEKRILLGFKHPHIVKLHSTFSCDRYLYFLLEWLPGGDIFTRLRDGGRFCENKTKFYAANILLALEHMHENGVAYRDLKPENLMLDTRGYVKLVDFGFAKKLEEKTFSYCGTPDYVAPEIIIGMGHNQMVDWWSFGVVIYEMLTGFPPFFTNCRTRTYRKILQGDVKFPAFTDNTAKDLISRLLHINSQERLGSKRGAQEIKSHPWFAGFDWESLNKGLIEAPIPVRLDSHCSDQFFDVFSETSSVADEEHAHLTAELSESVCFKDF